MISMPVRRFNIRNFYCIFLVAALLNFNSPAAQKLTVINKPEIYHQAVTKDSFQQMIEIKSLVPNVVYDLHYATKKNFTEKKLYKNGKTTFVRLAVGLALQKVAEDLAVQGFGLKIWDAYRPYAATKQMWDLIHDERYVANPATGSGHNRGIAVDLTLVNLKTGIELNMGTGFDNFTDTAHHTFKTLTDSVLRNRELLKTTMGKFGFHALETEWWHYSFPNDRSYEVLDLPFKTLAKNR